MNLASLAAWSLFALAMAVLGRYGGVLVVLGRAIDNTRAAIRCAGLSWSAAKGEWRRNWESSLHWVRWNR